MRRSPDFKRSQAGTCEFDVPIVTMIGPLPALDKHRGNSTVAKRMIMYRRPKRTFMVLAGICLLSACSPARAANHYVSQSGGTFSGGSACNGQTTESIATFNGATPSAGEKDTLCGTITTTLQINASGTSGNLIAILADTGASIQVGGGSGKAIEMNSNTYLLLDGGTACGPGVSVSGCGQLAITNNGSPQGGFATNDLATLFDSMCSSAGTVEIRNWQLGPVYQHTSPS